VVVGNVKIPWVMCNCVWQWYIQGEHRYGWTHRTRFTETS